MTSEAVRETSRPGRRRPPSPALIRTISVVFFLTVWQLVGSFSSALSVPTVVKMAHAWWVMMLSGELPRAIGISMQATLVGFLAAVIVGVPLGLLMGRYQRFEEAMDIYVSLLVVLPMMALVPIIITVLGFTMAARAAVVFLFALISIVVNAAAGVKQAEHALLDMAHSFGANRLQVFFHILLPAALPATITGLRLGLGRAFAGMISAEMLVSSVGLGNLIVEHSARFDSDYVFAALITVITTAIVAMQGFRLIENRFMAWRTTDSRR